MVANTERQEPWSEWESLPVESSLAVQMGVVAPIICPSCGPERFSKSLKLLLLDAVVSRLRR